MITYKCDDSLRAQRGFTLVEMAISVIIFGILVVMGFTMFEVYNRISQRDTMRDKFWSIRQSLDTYYRQHKRLPCPAPLFVDRDSDEYGNSGSGAGGDCSQTTVASGSCSSDGVCVADGRGGLRVRIGMVPIRQLQLDYTYSVDMWKNRIVYVVTENLAHPSNTYSNTDRTDDGAIALRDQNGNLLTSSVSGAPAGVVEYLVLSYGKNGRGAYPSQGVPSPTRATLLDDCDVTSSEGENCDLDADFVLNSEPGQVQGANFYDDILLYGLLGHIQ